jgi:hypothetical protein
MNKTGLCVILAGVLTISVLLSGCQDTNSLKTQERPQNVYLDSTIVEFANVSYEENINKSGNIDSVKVGWLFHNIAGKLISAKIDVKFYNTDDFLLFNETKYIRNMPADYTEQSFQLSNQVIYQGAGARYVDHVVISVTNL